MTLTTIEKPQKKNVFEAILARRSVRTYAPDGLDRNTVQTLLEAAALRRCIQTTSGGLATKKLTRSFFVFAALILLGVGMAPSANAAYTFIRPRQRQPCYRHQQCRTGGGG